MSPGQSCLLTRASEIRMTALRSTLTPPKHQMRPVVVLSIYDGARSCQTIRTHLAQDNSTSRSSGL